ncbi:MAG: hypothetical protein ACYCT7_06925 [bacterium]
MFEQKLPILINGRTIKFKDISLIAITSTTLIDDEIESFALKNNFAKAGENYEFLFFAHSEDETNNLLKSPYLLDYAQSNFVHSNIIKELKKITTGKLDTTKLIQLCKELNIVSNKSCHYSKFCVMRMITDHIAPAFGYPSFKECANNYNGGQSLKKVMMSLNNNMRPIADCNIHSTMRSREILPSKTPSKNQSDFKQEFELLLSEVLKIL